MQVESESVQYEIHQPCHVSPSEILATAASLIGNYIWHKEPFVLSNDLKGITHFGECIDDEWFIVYVLRQLSAQFGLVVTMQDSDGDFILFEACDELPRWLNPENAPNRVFIYQGNLHLVPISLKAQADLSSGIETILKFPRQTKASESIQKAAFQRVRGYPKKLALHYHKAKLLVSPLVAHLLSIKPNLVTAATQAFYTRDAISSRPCFKMETFGTDSVETIVQFTRITYAQLLSTSFHPPKVFVPPSRTSSAYKAFDLGMKLACGFEILYHDKHLRRKSQSDHSNYDFERDPNYVLYINKLKSLGFFENQRQGSHRYQILESRAKSGYFESTKQIEFARNPYADMQRILESFPMPDNIVCSNEPEDSDDWMLVDPETLEQDWQNSGKCSVSDEESENESESLDQEDIKDLDQFADMIQKFKGFFGQEGDLEGVVVPSEFQELSSDEDNVMEELPDEAEMKKRVTFKQGPDSDDESGSSDNETEMQKYMDQMDRELYSTKAMSSFERVKVLTTDEFKTSDDEFEPIDVDANLLKNALASFSAQQGLSGPMSTLMTSLGIPLPKHQ